MILNLTVLLGVGVGRCEDWGCQGEDCTPLVGTLHSVLLNSSNAPTAPLPTCSFVDSDPGEGRSTDPVALLGWPYS